jgi:ABC-type dipeptide/oligopeptide/nickel transport system permease subunit
LNTSGISARSATRVACAGLLSTIFLAALLAGYITQASYETQFREDSNLEPSAKFLLGTDELGRDRLSRLLYGSRVSLLLAPAAAALATSIGLAFGVSAAYFGGATGRVAFGLADLVASTPSLLLLLFARALLPLNVSPAVSVTITFALLGAVGWPSGVRVFAAAARNAQSSDYVRQARALGSRPRRILALHIASAIRPLVAGQFWTLLPVFLLAEANLGMLGLGVSEPLPSLGNLLAEVPLTPALWKNPVLLAPALLLATVLISLQGLLRKESSS